MAVVHIVPAAVFSNTYHGSYKDTISRVRFLEKHAPSCHQISIESDDAGFVLEQLAQGERHAFLIEYSTFPCVVQAIRKQFPGAFMAVRSHNLEPLQHFDNLGWWPKKGPLWMAYGMGRLFRNDLIVKKHASAVWSISDWENRVYWDRLPGRATVEWLPYHCPEHLLPDSITPPEQRRRIVCLPTSQNNRKSWDLVTRFISFAEQMRQMTGDQYEYLITGNLKDWGLPESEAVSYTGMIDDLRSFLQTVRAVAMLSDKGYGFKTTIGDAIAHGAVVLAHPKLAGRCPDVLNPAIVRVDSNKSSDVTSVIESLRRSPTFEYLDTRLRHCSAELLVKAYSMDNHHVGA